jgi:uncharacterized DUF497 family protein
MGRAGRILAVGFEWDAVKAESNARKHGLRFDDAAVVFDDWVLAIPDTSTAQDVRWLGLGRLGSLVVVVVYTEPRPEIIRVISMRKALKHEERKYWESYPV